MQADSSMKVHMLERELARAQKDIMALRCQLACQRDCPPGSAATNPALLRTAAVSAVGDISIGLLWTVFYFAACHLDHAIGLDRGQRTCTSLSL